MIHGSFLCAEFCSNLVFVDGPFLSVQVPVEAERLVDNDLVLEQYLSPASPLLAGFRLDFFSAIKPRVTHSPCSQTHVWDTSITLLEDRHISPAVLYIQVSAFQVVTRPALFLCHICDKV